jgi:beta-glucosidase
LRLFDSGTSLTRDEGDWVEPYDPDSADDVAACERKLEFSISWFADPIYLGDYPASMKAQLGDRLPTWSAADIALVKGSNDFYGQNHYCANYIKHIPGTPPAEDYLGGLDQGFFNVKGEAIGPDTQSPWLKPNPPGFRKLMKWISDRYGKPTIYITENGTSVLGENDKSKEEILDDEFRVEYFRGYVKAVAEAVAEDGVDCRGYMAWSLME